MNQELKIPKTQYKEEGKNVSQVIRETVTIESELDFLRDQFWHMDAWSMGTRSSEKKPNRNL